MGTNRHFTKASILALGALLAFGAGADVTTIAVGNATVDANTASALSFPVTRSGDLSYDAYLSYHTKNGSAVAGTNYTGISGSIRIPASAGSASIAVPVAPGSGADKTMQLLLDSAVGVGPAPNFPAAESGVFVTGTNPTSVVSADLNGDGKPDMVVANFRSNTVSVRINITVPGSTVPNYGTEYSFTTAAQPISVTAADINGDGKPDLLVADQGAGVVSVFINTTKPGSLTPTFISDETFGVGSKPTSVVAIDVDGDGKPDLLTANYGDNTVSVRSNTTTPGSTMASFAAEQTFATGTEPTAVTAIDLNGDDKPDLVVSNRGSNDVSLLENTTDSAAADFKAQQTFAAGSGPYSVAVADVNGDGKADLLVANQYSNNVSVLLNSTAPGAATFSFATEQTFATDSGPTSITTADLDGDGKPDLLVANSGNTTVSVLKNVTAPGATTAGFVDQTTFNSGLGAFAVTAADVNGDGKPDLLVANSTGDTVTVLLSDTPITAAEPSFAAQQTLAQDSSANFIAIADFNGDGKPDLVAANASSNNVSVLLSDTKPGSATASFEGEQNFATGKLPGAVVAARLLIVGNRPELVVANVDSNTVSVLLNQTVPGALAPAFSPETARGGGDITYAAGTNPISVAVADFNGDGKPDLVVANEFSNNVSVLENQLLIPNFDPHPYPFFADQQTFPAGSQPYRVAVADINGDGKPDLVVVNIGTGVSVLLNTTAPGKDTFTFSAPQHFPAGSFPLSVAVADLNGDGKTDLVVGEGQGNAAVVLLNTTQPGSANATFSSPHSFATGTESDVLTTADVNGDGRPDLLVTSNNGYSFISVLLNTTAPGANTPSFGSPLHVASIPDPGSIVTADVNGDGLPDLLVADGDIAVFLNTELTAKLGTAAATGTLHYTSPNPPTGIKATPGNGQIALTWNSDRSATSYKVYDSTSSGAEKPTAATSPALIVTPSGSGSTVTANITNLTNQTEYYLKISAVNGVGESPLSAEVSAKPVPPP